MSDLEDRCLDLLREAGLPEPERQYRFARPRRYAADFCWVPQRIILECEGGTWVWGMGHSRGSSIRRDVERSNLAQTLGWRYYRVTSDMVRQGCRELIAMLRAELLGSGVPVPAELPQGG